MGAIFWWFANELLPTDTISYLKIYIYVKSGGIKVSSLRPLLEFPCFFYYPGVCSPQSRATINSAEYIICGAQGNMKMGAPCSEIRKDFKTVTTEN